MYIFGYGSLVNINSAQKSFKRKLKPEDFIPVVIDGYTKTWNSIEYIVFEGEDKIVEGVFLNLKKDEQKSTNGVLLKISDDEFENLKLREKNYSCVEITAFKDFKPDEKVYTFMTTNDDKIAKDGCKNCFIPKKYITLLEEKLYNYDESFKKEFISSYSEFRFPIKDGAYIFSDPIQNKFAKDGIA